MPQKPASPDISILVSVYNSEFWLHRCLDSLCAQDWENLEIVVVNDGSNGNCREIVSDYAARDPRLVYIEHERNKGALRAKLTGIAAARGKYCIFVDSDDYLEPGSCRAAMETAASTGADIIGIPFTIEAEGRDMLRRQGAAFGKVLRGDALKRAFFSRRMNWSLWGKAFKTPLVKELLEMSRLSGLRLNIHDDLVLCLPLLLEAGSFAGARGGCYKYFRREGSVSADPPAADRERWVSFCREAAKAFTLCREFLLENRMQRLLPAFEGMIRHQFFRLLPGLDTAPAGELPGRVQALFSGFDPAFLADTLRPGQFRYLCMALESQVPKSRALKRAGILIDAPQGGRPAFSQGKLAGLPDSLEEILVLPTAGATDGGGDYPRTAPLPEGLAWKRWKALQAHVARYRLDVCFLVDMGGQRTPFDILALRGTPCLCVVLRRREVAGEGDGGSGMLQERRSQAYALADKVLLLDIP